MKMTIKTLSPHQNGKVVAVLSAVITIPFVLLMAVIATRLPPVDQHGNPVNFPYFMLIIMPLLYLVFGYLFTALWCAVYNWIVKYTGGLEFETSEENAG